MRDVRWHPLSEIYHRPITAIIVVLIGVYMIWFGVILFHYERMVVSPSQYLTGPLMYWSLGTWGWVYVVLGVVKILRIFLMQFVWLSRALHFLALFVLVDWAAALDLSSPLSLLQPATTLMAILGLINPWITQIIMRSGEPEYLLRMRAEQRSRKDNRSFLRAAQASAAETTPPM